MNENGCTFANFPTLAYRLHNTQDSQSETLIELILYQNWTIDCCAEPFDGFNSDSCYAIPVRTSDSFYGPRNFTCHNFHRSVQFCEENGGPRQQFNAVTHFVDASQVRPLKISRPQLILKCKLWHTSCTHLC